MVGAFLAALGVKATQNLTPEAHISTTNLHNGKPVPHTRKSNLSTQPHLLDTRVPDADNCLENRHPERSVLKIPIAGMGS